MPPDNNIKRPNAPPKAACDASERPLNQLASAEAMEERRDDKDGGK